MDFQTLWFILWGVLWAVYFMLDGFDFGAGALLSVLGRTEHERRTIIHSIGPVWNGNEVWLITAGGATFAAFPGTYASLFSYLYTALLLVLFSLIVRGVAMEFRGMEPGEGWRQNWDLALMVSSFLPALLFGVAFGNIFQGFPMDAAGYHGSLLSLLNPYGLLTGALFVMLFLVHGALWISIKTDDVLAARASDIAGKLWFGLLGVAVLFLASTAFATNLYANYLKNVVLFVVPAIAVLSLLGIKMLQAGGKMLGAFAASCLTIVSVVATGLIGLFPNLIPSTMDPKFSLDIYNSSSSVYTLKIMTAVVFIFLPIAIAYQIWSYKVFGAKITSEEMKKTTY